MNQVVGCVLARTRTNYYSDDRYGEKNRSNPQVYRIIPDKGANNAPSAAPTQPIVPQALAVRHRRV
jgi:hypothetical protein